MRAESAVGSLPERSCSRATATRPTRAQPSIRPFLAVAAEQRPRGFPTSRSPRCPAAIRVRPGASRGSREVRGARNELYVNRPLIRPARHLSQPPVHAPNAALLIDFDNVTMGIRSDLTKELRTLLNSDIIKGKVAVQRAYADWRRYPQYIVPLAESSIDLIFAPAYGSRRRTRPTSAWRSTRSSSSSPAPRSGPSSCSPATPTSRAWSSSSRSTASTSSASASASRRATCWSRTATSTTRYNALAGLTKEATTPSKQRGSVGAGRRGGARRWRATATSCAPTGSSR